ncbi:MAG: alanine:cation symporter family protein [Spirochaetaceae bacterium]|nr:alanine:cation symporter family protein [Myxococcales bacterium]MCB9723566.1 alanine:cation symporter family protein [Spirochaetaceae bacterium]HPG27530.1 alanine/glycine:cation symporter family protein [Myxococcota bacterium]
MPSETASPGSPLFETLEAIFARGVVAPIERVIFFDLAFWDDASGDAIQIPIVVAWLVLGALYFTLRFQFVNVRGFRHGIDIVRGRYSEPGDAGEISHFQALSAALSATVGLGNIAGVAFAVGIGGPGAVFWMIMGGLLGMSSKFAECTLAQRYRTFDERGRVTGGPMIYLREGLSELGWRRLGAVLSVVFSIMCIGASFGGGNMFQANQSYALVRDEVAMLSSSGGQVTFGLLLVVLVGLVIIGGIRRIGEVASVLVPGMCLLYMACGLAIVATHASAVPGAIGLIVRDAFSLEAGVGGLVGTLIQGFRRAAFSNEAGIGSAAIAHSAARTDEPLREGFVALLEPFIDTIVVCSTTALVIVVTGTWNDPEAGAGIRMTASAFATVFPWFPKLLTFVAVLFAFSTMISWSYYGERAWKHLFGERSILAYQLIFLAFTFGGVVFENAKVVLDFGDLMILGMAFPNIAGVAMLAGRLKQDLDRYLARLAAGEFHPHA